MKNLKNVNLLLVYLVSFIYMELIFKLLVGIKIFRLSTINLLLFLVFFSLIVYVLSKVLKEKGNKIVSFIITFIVSLWVSAQYVVKSYFDFYISLSTFEVADQLGDFMSKVFSVIFSRLPGMILIFIPFILIVVFNKYINFEKNAKKSNLIYLGISLLVFIIYLLSLNLDKKDDYSSYRLYYKVNNVSLNIESFGVINSFFIDTYRAIFGFEEELTFDDNLNDNVSDSDDEIVYKYNNLDIDFNELLENESDSTIKLIHEYMSSDTGTLQNEYTGMFKGKNLIVFMAESFNEIAVREDLTPTLYKLVNSGFVFENFYTPTIYSTIGGEFQELTGLYAQSTSILSKFRSGDIYFPQGLGTVFKNINYSTYAYHNNSYNFQDRDKYLYSMGFDNFKACYNGLESLINCKKWPQSDVEMINATINDYINEDNFMVFYATVSGHASYTWGNASAKKHKEEYLQSGLDYSTGPASYLAAQMELDKALEVLIKTLDEKGILEDTVIALVGDHYPYELSISEINEISSYEKDAVVEVNHSNFILWNSEMDTVHVSKVGSQLDVMPTIYNVFGIEYDSRLFIGKDILSTESGLAIFGNNSWVTDKGTYYAASRKFVPKEGVEVEGDYVSKINKIVQNKITMSKLIIENNYYKKVLK